VIAAHNEAGRLPARVQNLLALDYPAGRREIILVDDGSTDGTADALGTCADAVRVITVPRGGKGQALNRGVAGAAHEIVVFADARQTWAPGALRALTAPFADPAVGGVTGELMLGAASPSGVAEGVGLYWRYEKALRRLESRIGSTLGATGAIYALR